MKQIKFFLLAIALIVIVASCSKKDAGANNNGGVPKVTSGIYILNQGSYGANNTSLTYYDFGTDTATTDYYAGVNNTSLGTAGTDFIVYGSKMYVVMNTSGNVTVTNALTAKLIDTISFIVSGVNRQPENIVSAGTNVFVSSTDGTVSVIDTATLAVIKVIPVGANPAQMIVSGNDLYVSNTGAITASAYDSTLSVIDLTSLTETRKIRVGINPGALAADNAGNLYVACAGDYDSNPPLLAKVSTTSNSVVFSADTAVYSMRYYNNNLYVTPAYGSTAASVRVLNTTDFSAATPSFITDGTTITTAYGLDIDPSNGDVYVDDAKDYSSDGTVYCFDQTGKKKFTVSKNTGINPCKVILIHQ